MPRLRGSGADWRASGGEKVIVEGLVDFDYEITLLTVRHVGGTSFCEPIGHRQEGGDYRESWQPQPMSAAALTECQRIAELVTTDLGGHGLFGVEFFIRGDEVWFSEVSPRPARHRAGHTHRSAIVGIRPACACDSRPADSADPPARRGCIGRDSCPRPIDGHRLRQPRPGLGRSRCGHPPLRQAGSGGERRMGVALARADTIEGARSRARAVADAVRVTVL